MDMVTGFAMVIGIAPALILMFLGVRNYTYPRVEQPFFSDPSFFLLFVVGLVEGSLLFLVFWFFSMSSIPMPILTILVAIIQSMMMVVTLNLKRYRGKSDSVFYGFGLGLGNACGMATGFCFIIYGSLIEADVGLDISAVSLVLISVSMALMIGAGGTTVGEGIARHRVMEFALQAMIPLVVFFIMLGLAVSNGDGFAFYLFLVLMLIIGGFYYYLVMMKRLPAVVREVLRMEGKKRDDLPK